PRRPGRALAACLGGRNPEPGREEARGLARLDVRDEQAFLAVGLVAEKRPVGTRDRRRRRRSGARVVDGREVARVLGGATQDGVLVEGVRGIAVADGPITVGLRLVELRMEDDVRAL